MRLGVVDAGIVIGWLQRRHRSLRRIETLMTACRRGRLRLAISVVNLAEVLIHTRELARATGVDPVALVRACGVQIHLPDESVARRVAQLPTSLADGFAAATAQELGARLHTTDAELARRLDRTRLPISRY